MSNLVNKRKSLIALAAEAIFQYKDYEINKLQIKSQNITQKQTSKPPQIIPFASFERNPPKSLAAETSILDYHTSN